MRGFSLLLCSCPTSSLCHILVSGFGLDCSFSSVDIISRPRVNKPVQGLFTGLSSCVNYLIWLHYSNTSKVTIQLGCSLTYHLKNTLQRIKAHTNGFEASWMSQLSVPKSASAVFSQCMVQKNTHCTHACDGEDFS